MELEVPIMDVELEATTLELEIDTFAILVGSVTSGMTLRFSGRIVALGCINTGGRGGS